MPVWIFFFMALVFLFLVVCGAIVFAPDHRLIQWLTRPVRVWFWLKWSEKTHRPMTYAQAYWMVWFLDRLDRNSL